MSWLFRHKLLLILIIAFIWYWHKNPSDGFGMHRPGFIVFNRIPILLFDCYISPDGKLHLEDDLSKETNITYWINNHLVTTDIDSVTFMHLLIGTGFNNENHITFSAEQVQHLRNKHIVLEVLSTEEAIRRYNEIKDDNQKIGILLKVR